MSTKKQIKANRRNALKSTGPSPAGKQVSATNATKHGLFTEHLIVRDEDLAAFRQFSEHIHAEFRPQGPTEAFYVEHLIDQCWRLRTCLKLETDLFDYYRVYENERGNLGIAFAHDASQKNAVTRLSEYAPRFQRGLLKDIAELRRLQARASRPSNPPREQAQPIGSGADDKAQAANTETARLTIATTQTSTLASAQPAPVAQTCFGPIGTLASQVVLSDENKSQFERHLEGLFAEWQPRRASQVFFVEVFAATSWRLARLSRVEAELFEQYRSLRGADLGLATAFVKDAMEMDCFSKLASCETRLRNALDTILNQLLT
jgi:hypothetical protein